MGERIETIYPAGADESTATVRVAVEYDDYPGFTPWEDNDGWVSVIVPLRVSYYPSSHSDSAEFAQRVQDLYRNEIFTRAMLERWVRIVTGSPVKIVNVSNDYQALVFLDPARCEEAGAALTEATLDAEVTEFSDYVSGSVYGLRTEQRTALSYTVRVSHVQPDHKGGTLTEVRTLSTEHRNDADLMAARWGVEVETIEPEWVEHPDDETVWGVIGYDYALTEAQSMADAAAKASAA